MQVKNNIDISLPETRKKAVMLALAILMAVALAVLFFATVERTVSRIYPDCLLRSITGLKCFLCGGTRCAREVLKGNIAKAFYYNPFVMLWGLIAAVWYIRFAVCLFRKEYRPQRIKGEFLWILLVSILVFSVVRNLGFYQSIFY